MTTTTTVSSSLSPFLWYIASGLAPKTRYPIPFPTVIVVQRNVIAYPTCWYNDNDWNLYFISVHDGGYFFIDLVSLAVRFRLKPTFTSIMFKPAPFSWVSPSSITFLPLALRYIFNYTYTHFGCSKIPETFGFTFTCVIEFQRFPIPMYTNTILYCNTLLFPLNLLIYYYYYYYYYTLLFGVISSWLYISL
jgi:hypothetical protein